MLGLELSVWESVSRLSSGETLHNARVLVTDDIFDVHLSFICLVVQVILRLSRVCGRECRHFTPFCNFVLLANCSYSQNLQTNVYRETKLN